MLKANPKTSWSGNECLPTIADSSHVDETASITGDVRIGEEVYVGPCASLRADEASPIIIGDKCNIQDGGSSTASWVAPSSSAKRSQ